MLRSKLDMNKSAIEKLLQDMGKQAHKAQTHGLIKIGEPFPKAQLIENPRRKINEKKRFLNR